MIRFWLVETPPERRFKADNALDRTIAARFGALRDEVIACDAAGWRDPRGLLAAVILIDQFSRNLHRGQAAAFAHDALARELADDAITRGWDAGMTADERAFLYMPFMHGEDMASQDRSIALFTALGVPEQIDFAQRHRAQIVRFGRFLGRNAALGRATTSEEQAALEAGGAF